MMKLVDYSDSDESESDTVTKQPGAVPAPAQTFQTTAARKIRINLPVSDQPLANTGASDEQPAAKRIKKSSGLGGFNSLLPAPKRAATKSNGLQKGINLRTSSEAAFSRGASISTSEDGIASVEQVAVAVEPAQSHDNNNAPAVALQGGSATRFKPLSVANNKKKNAKKPKVIPTEVAKDHQNNDVAVDTKTTSTTGNNVEKSKKRSLFSVHQTEDPTSESTNTGEYESILVSESPAIDRGKDKTGEPQEAQNDSAAQGGNSLEAIASDLNLTAAQRRQLFGRSAKNMQADVNIANFNMDSEYAFNEQMRQAGQLVEHRAVKTISAGKHSLSQLVNNARNNQESIEDKWAEGRRNRGEGGSKYGWSK